MIALAVLLLLSGGQADTDALMRAASARLRAGGAPVAAQEASWRLDGVADAGPGAKERAIRADGSACGTIGPVPCRRPPRRLLSAPIGR